MTFDYLVNCPDFPGDNVKVFFFREMKRKKCTGLITYLVKIKAKFGTGDDAIGHQFLNSLMYSRSRNAAYPRYFQERDACIV